MPGTRQLEDRLSRAFGIVASVIGLLLVVGGTSPSYAGPAGEIGLVFGVLGHLLGARRLGAAVVVVSVAQISIGFDDLSSAARGTPSLPHGRSETAAQLPANAIEVLTALCGSLRGVALIIEILFVFPFVVPGK